VNLCKFLTHFIESLKM